MSPKCSEMSSIVVNVEKSRRVTRLGFKPSKRLPLSLCPWSSVLTELRFAGSGCKILDALCTWSDHVVVGVSDTPVQPSCMILHSSQLLYITKFVWFLYMDRYGYLVCWAWCGCWSPSIDISKYEKPQFSISCHQNDGFHCPYRQANAQYHSTATIFIFLAPFWCIVRQSIYSEQLIQCSIHEYIWCYCTMSYITMTHNSGVKWWGESSWLKWSVQVQCFKKHRIDREHLQNDGTVMESKELTLEWPGIETTRCCNDLKEHALGKTEWSYEYILYHSSCITCGCEQIFWLVPWIPSCSFSVSS